MRLKIRVTSCLFLSFAHFSQEELLIRRTTSSYQSGNSLQVSRAFGFGRSENCNSSRGIGKWGRGSQLLLDLGHFTLETALVKPLNMRNTSLVAISVITIHIFRCYQLLTAPVPKGLGMRPATMVIYLLFDSFEFFYCFVFNENLICFFANSNTP